MQVAYSDWAVVREEMKPCKKRSDESSSERRYSIVVCKHCDEELSIASSNFTCNKKRAIDDHLIKCKEFMGERPSKRKAVEGRGLIVVKKTNEEWEDMKKRMSEMEEKLERTNKIVAQHQVWWCDAAEALGYNPPQDPPFLVVKMRELRQNREQAMLEYKQNMVYMITEKNKTIDQKDEILEDYKKQIEVNDANMKRLEKQAEEYMSKSEEFQKTAEQYRLKSEETMKTSIEAMQKLDRLKRENEALKTKMKAEIKTRTDQEREITKRYGKGTLLSMKSSLARVNPDTDLEAWYNEYTANKTNNNMTNKTTS